MAAVTENFIFYLEIFTRNHNFFVSQDSVKLMAHEVNISPIIVVSNICTEMKEVASVQLDKINVKLFYQAINIYLRKTQVVNRKLSCSTNIAFLKLNLATRENEIKTNLAKQIQASDDLAANWKDVFAPTDFSEADQNELKDFDEFEDEVYVSLDRMIPRNIQKFKNCVLTTVIGAC